MLNSFSGRKVLYHVLGGSDVEGYLALVMNAFLEVTSG